MLQAIHEIAIYIHRFHNLDLFQQGWYQIKVTMRWEDENSSSFGTPARVVQYEASDLDSDYVCGIWRIDDVDHSFSTQPFRIKYAKQDIPLSMMVTFNLLPREFKDPSTTAVILTFELLYSPVLDCRGDIHDYLDETAAIHEFRLPPKSLLGSHAYCPVHFDAFHAVLVDVTVHASLLKMDYTSSQKVPSDPTTIEDDIREYDKSKQVMVVQALSSSRGILLEDLQRLSKAINQPIDVEDIASSESFGSTPISGLEIPGGEISGESSNQMNNFSESEKLNGAGNFQNDEFFLSLSEAKLLELIDSIGNQVLDLWSIFFKFHRANRRKILEFLHNQWATDRKFEWSTWMVRTKIKIPERYIGCWVDESSYQPVNGRPTIPQKIIDDPAHTAAKQAEFHRQSIAKLMMENRFIQDLHVSGDLLRIPVVIVEQAINVPKRSFGGNSCSRLGQKDENVSAGFGNDHVNALSSAHTHSNGRVLKIAVFVHGFQGHHLDLRLIRNQWLLIDPKVEFLMSEVNEEKTSGDFREMGQRLAKEVVSFVKKKMDKVTRSGVLNTIKLSFVGHSIGNIILRTALTDSIMEPYLEYLHTYLSVSGPHLGYLYCPNSLFNGGLWLMKKLKGTPCIHQLTFTDDPDLEKTFLYKLSKHKTLEHFRNIILLSSPQDGYVPYHSARIEMCAASSGDHSKKGGVFVEMLNECLDQIRAKRSSEPRVFMRCDVNFDLSSQGKTIDTMIGRAAHIEFLDSDIYARFIMWSFPELFT